MQVHSHSLSSIFATEKKKQNKKKQTKKKTKKRKVVLSGTRSLFEEWAGARQNGLTFLCLRKQTPHAGSVEPLNPLNLHVALFS